MEKIRTNSFFEKALQKSAKVVNVPIKALSLVSAALSKSEKVQERSDKLGGLVAQLELSGRMLKAYYSRQYLEVPADMLVKLIGAMIYFIWAIDLIPDFIFGIGFIDDIAVVSWVLLSFQDQLERFRMWEEGGHKIDKNERIRQEKNGIFLPEHLN